jgi:hypothetical protein
MTAALVHITRAYISAEKTPDKQPLFELIVESEEELQKLLTRLRELQQRSG